MVGAMADCLPKATLLATHGEWHQLNPLQQNTYVPTTSNKTRKGAKKRDSTQEKEEKKWSILLLLGASNGGFRWFFKQKIWQFQDFCFSAAIYFI